MNRLLKRKIKVIFDEEKVDTCNILNSDLDIAFGGHDGCFKSRGPCKNCALFDGCEAQQERQIRLRCWGEGRPCSVYESWVDETIQLEDQCKWTLPEKEEQVILISGGYNGGGLRSVEAFHPQRDLSLCSLPDMPRGRRWHTMSEWTVCGGYGGEDTCITLSDTGNWITSHKLTVKRYNHVDWKVDANKSLLLGGEGIRKTTEIITEGVTQAQTGPFTLKYDTS